MMEIINLVVTGTVGAGKSTFIRSVREIEVVDTDKQATDIDFGTLQFDDEIALHIYGTPSQIGFDPMWDIAVEHAHAYLLLIAAHQPNEFQYARRMMNFMNRRAQIPMMMGITHSDCDGAWSSAEIALALGYPDKAQQPPIILINAQDPESVVMSLLAVVEYYQQSTTAVETMVNC